jgi:hypothetical protein
MLVSLHDSSNGSAITNGFFTGAVGISWNNRGSGNYDVRIGNNTWFGCDSPSHRVAYINSAGGTPAEVALVKDVWP